MAKNARRACAKIILVVSLLVSLLMAQQTVTVNAQSIQEQPAAVQIVTEEQEAEAPSVPDADCTFTKSWDSTDFLFTGREYTATYSCYTFIPNPFDAVIMTATVSSGKAISVSMKNSTGETIGGCIQTIGQAPVRCQRQFGTVTQYTVLTYVFEVTGTPGVTDGWIEVNHTSFDGSNPNLYHLDVRISAPQAIANIYLPLIQRH